MSVEPQIALPRSAANRPRGRRAAFIAFALVLSAIPPVACVILVPDFAVAAALLGVVCGAGAMAILWKREAAADFADTLIPNDERQADRRWEMSDIAEHYRRNTDGRRRAEAASEAKSRFLATVSHELRTPLSGVLGLSTVLLDTPLSGEQETFARAVKTSGELMLGLVDDMLDFAKIEAGRFTLNPQPTAITSLAEEVVELFATRAEAKGIDLSADISPAVPDIASIDAPRARQVLINLVANAVKFTDRGGVALRVDTPEGMLRFTVEDTGPGIPADAVESIFAEFATVATDPVRRGSGLGLSISRRIVRGMGGDILVGARDGGGAAFSFAIAIGRAVAVPNAPTPDLAGRKALILAPAGLAPVALARQLADAGASARITEQAEQAAALAGAAAAAGEAYDFVLIDPRATAAPAAALATIRDAAGRPLPAAILVAAGRRQPEAELRAAGFDAYLVRPVRRASLLRIAQQLATGEGGFGVDPGDRRTPPPARPRAATGLRVLLAEDDEINALLLRALVVRLGHELTEFADGAAALAATAEQRFDVLLLDIHLPGLSGLEIARAVRAAEAATDRAPALIVAVSADGRPESRDLALAAGFDRFVQKPLTAEQLREAIASPRQAPAAVA